MKMQTTRKYFRLFLFSLLPFTFCLSLSAALSPPYDGNAANVIHGDWSLGPVSGAGLGDVTGPGSSTDNALARFDSTTGKILQNSVGILTDAGALSGIASLSISGSGNGLLTLWDNAGTHHVNLIGPTSITTNLNWIYPAAPNTGLIFGTLSAGTNETLSIVAVTALEASYLSGVTSALQTQLTAKAPLASPTFTGTPAVPNVVLTDSSTTIAPTAFVKSNITAYASVTATFTGKTFDAAGSGNVLSQTKYQILIRPDYGDGAGAIPQTNSYVASGLMHYTFSGSAETNVNYVVYETVVPPDIDTTVAMTATIAFISGGTDADVVTFHLTYALGASGTALPTGTAIATAPIVVSKTPTTPASGDVQISAATTLTGWAASMTAGTPLFIRMARLDTANDDTARDMSLTIAYGSTQ